jgi:hypothetical protein
VFLPADSRVARNALPHLRAEAWGVRDGARPASASDLGEHLGRRLLTFHAAELETTVSALVRALPSTGAARAS